MPSEGPAPARRPEGSTRPRCNQTPWDTAMLAELVVRDLGVIEGLSLVLGPGMTALTGETGAGKTMVLGAIGLLAGGRADPSMVRPGAAEATVEGRFVMGDEELVLTRVVPADGRSRAYRDGRPLTAGDLAELTAGLVDLHGQHAAVGLLATPSQRRALDRYAAIDLGPLEAARQAVRARRGRPRGSWEATPAPRARDLDFLRFQLDELEAAGIQGPDEDEVLAAEEELLADADAHRAAAAAAEARARHRGRRPRPDRRRPWPPSASALPFAALARPPRGRRGRARGRRPRAAHRRGVDRVRSGPALASCRRGVRRWASCGGSTAAARARRCRRCWPRRDELSDAARRARVATRSGRRRPRRPTGWPSRRRPRRRRRWRSGAGRRPPPSRPRSQAGLGELGLPRAEVAIEVGRGRSRRRRRASSWRSTRGCRRPRWPRPPRVASWPARCWRCASSSAPACRPWCSTRSTPGSAARPRAAVGRALAALAVDKQVLVVTHLPQVAAFADAQVAISEAGRRPHHGGERRGALRGRPGCASSPGCCRGSPRATRARSTPRSSSPPPPQERGR